MNIFNKYNKFSKTYDYIHLFNQLFFNALIVMNKIK